MVENDSIVMSDHDEDYGLGYEEGRKDGEDAGECRMMAAVLKTFTLKQWGTRCEEHDDNCPLCKAWALYDKFCELNGV